MSKSTQTIAHLHAMPPKAIHKEAIEGVYIGSKSLKGDPNSKMTRTVAIGTFDGVEVQVTCTTDKERMLNG